MLSSSLLFRLHLSILLQPDPLLPPPSLSLYLPNSPSLSQSPPSLGTESSCSLLLFTSFIPCLPLVVGGRMLPRRLVGLLGLLVLCKGKKNTPCSLVITLKWSSGENLVRVHPYQRGGIDPEGNMSVSYLEVCVCVCVCVCAESLVRCRKEQII